MSRQLIQPLSVTPQQNDKILKLLDLFEKWNRRINLSAASSRDELLEHVEDSLHVVPHLRSAKWVLDVGSGGGFPVLVAAICLPETEFISLEPIHKKHAYLSTAVRELPLTNVSPRAERIEDHQEHSYDAAMSRATFDIAKWMAMGNRYVKPGGTVIGFEAVVRDDLKEVDRHPYQLRGKPRNLVIAVTPMPST